MIKVLTTSNKGPFIIYGQGAGDFEGATYFWKVADGGPLIFGAKNLKKPAKPIFPCVSGKNVTKMFFEKNFHLCLAASKIKISAPLTINNEPSLNTVCTI